MQQKICYAFYMMIKITKKWVILGIVLILVGSITFLEIISRVVSCPKPPVNVTCNDLYEDEGLSVINLYKDTSDLELLSTLRQKRADNEMISKNEYKEAFEKLIIERDPKDMAGINGIACTNYGFVRNDLPSQAEFFVKRHELEHLLQTGKEGNEEFSANIAAGKEYPFGLLQTALISVVDRAKYYDSPLCYIKSLYKTFKVYFLPFK